MAPIKTVMYFRNGVGDLQPQIPSSGTAF